MSEIFENLACHFCDEPYPSPSCFISNYQGINVCMYCDEFSLDINFANQENGKCCVCLEDKNLVKLPTCTHRVCFGCCKTIYWGSTENVPPQHSKLMYNECPDWLYEYNDEDENDPELIKYNEYSKYSTIYDDILTRTYDENSYDELIKIRNKQFLKRPIWMNTEEFIQYENEYIRYNVNVLKAENDWEIYCESKIIGNGLCPLCRANPSKTSV
jgi:hypothetical protein